MGLDHAAAVHRPEHGHAGVQGDRPGRDSADLRRRARELSLLFVLFYVAASGNEQNIGTFERNFNTRDGAQMFRFAGGSQRICKKLARKLGRRWSSSHRCGGSSRAAAG